MTNQYNYRPANFSDYQQLLVLMPQLADFELPARRIAKDLWEGDAKILKAALLEKEAVRFADVAVDQDDQIVGLILVTMRGEMLSNQPSAHLETIIVAPAARRQGLGRALLQRAEQKAKTLGAQSMSLHVFSNNLRARLLYQSSGYDEEILRCIKWLD